MQRIITIVFSLLLAVALPLSGSAANFGAGNLVVVRVGTGAGTLSGTATAVFLDEYTSMGTLVQTIPLPTAVSGSNRPLTMSGSATSEGALRRSTDGRYLTMAGYAATTGTLSIAGTSSATVNRVVARIDATGTIDTTTAFNAYNTNNIRGAVTDDGTRFWTVGPATGVGYVPLGGASVTALNSANTRLATIFNSQLYVTSASGIYYGVNSVGTGLPTTAGQTATKLSGFPASGISSYGFVFSDANTLYVADDGANGVSSAGIQKWTYSGGTWTRQYILGAGTGVRGLTADVSGANVVLYATTTETSANKLITVTDTGSGASFTTLATAATNTAFRGIDFAPTSGATTVTVTATAAGAGAGTVLSSVGGINYGYPATSTGTTSALALGTDIVLTATAGATATASWTTCPGTAANNGTAAATCTINALDANKTAGATFTLNQYFPLTFTTDGHGKLTGNTSQNIIYDGSTTAVSASPSSGYVFVNWTGDNGFISTENPLIVKHVTATQNFRANFAGFNGFTGGNLVVTRSVYGGTATTVTVGQALPGGGVAVADGTYPTVFNNVTPDASFGVSSAIMLDQITTAGAPMGTLDVTAAAKNNPGVDLTTSFSSRTELAVNLSADSQSLTVMGYVAPVNTLDVSNANTPNNFDPNNPVAQSVQRAVAQISINGSVQVTPVNAYSGNNGRAALLANGRYYMVGNSGGNGAIDPPAGFTFNTGVQTTTPGGSADTIQVGSYVASDNKVLKDNNFRGETIFNNTLYVVKGSGNSGVNTVYQVGTEGNLPTGSGATISILQGFPTVLAKSAATPLHPFGIWFADADTLYVADDGNNTANDPNAGLQKWRRTGGAWQLLYTLTNGLNLNQPYSVAGLDSSLNPSTVGLRNITGTVNTDGTVTVYAITSANSAMADPGASPNKLVAITDTLSATTLQPGETFTTLQSAGYGEKLSGVSFAPFVPVYSTTVNPVGTLSVGQTATITSSPAGLDCIWNGSAPAGGTCTVNTISYGTKVVLTAAVPAGATMTWGAGCDSSDATTCTINSLTANMVINATFLATPVNGICGFDSTATPLAKAAPTDLCAPGGGIPSQVTGNGHPWTWSCAGAYGGSTANTCSATIKTFTLNFATDGNGAIDGVASQTIDFGGSSTPVTAKAKDNNTYYFFNWTGTNGFTPTTADPLTINNVTASQDFTANFKGGFAIFHVNDTHARLTPHKWIVTEHSTTTNPVFEDVGGAAYLASEMLQLTTTQPNSLVIDAGDISEGNPIGDMNGNGSMTQFYTLLSGKLKKVPGRNSRGMDAVVVGNHDVRDVNYISNLVALKNSGVPVISVNVRDAVTHQPYFAPYNIVTINGTRIGILGYTTQSAEVGASLASTLVVDPCDWDGASTTPDACHLAGYVNDLRNNQGCDVVVLAAHIGHSAIVDPMAPLLVDNASAKVPEIVVSGHWHTWTDTVWQPEILNYKTIFTESASYMKYIGELKVSDTGAYVSSTQHVIRDDDIVPEPDVQAFVNALITQYNAAADASVPPKPHVYDVIGYTADNLLLDNIMKWWSADEYPWSGNNTAGQWICDAMQWKAAQLFGQCDLAMETGGGVRADIPVGPVTYMQIYETFPWNDDTFNRINMTGQEIVNFIKLNNIDAGFSSALDVTAFDGVPTSVKVKGQPIDLNKTYTVAINNYMYAHPPAGWTWSDTQPLTSTVLCRDGIVDYMRQFTAGNPYRVGGDRYHLNTEFSGGYRAVVTMMNDNETKPSFDDAFIRFLSATPETLARRGGHQVPSDLVNADGAINAANRLSEAEMYRSFYGFKTGALKPGDIIETWGKGSVYGGNPEFVDQEGIYANGVEFKVVGHDDSLAKPVFLASIGAFWNDTYKNHYVQFLAKKTGTSNLVTDQNGRSIAIMDVTGYAAKSLPGSTGGTLLISGVPTMESYGVRFRCDKVTTSAIPLPTVSAVTSFLNPVPPGTTGSPLTLTATATTSAGTYYLTPMADAQVVSGKPTTNYGTSANLYVQSSNAGSYMNERSWMKFDLSGLPSGANISGASLQLWDWKSTGAALPTAVHGGADDSWTETGITWNTQPAYNLAPLATQTLTSGTINVWYSWDVSPFVLGKWSANKQVSLLVKAVTEDSPDATAPSYAFDAREYGSNAPVLQVTTQASGTVTVSRVQFFYRYAADNVSWGAWTSYATVTAAPYTTSFGYPSGQGYYEFYCQATDSLGNVEPAPAVAKAFTHYTNTPTYYPIISIDNVYQRYDGTSKQVTVTTIPAGANVNSVTYNGNATAPTEPGMYQVTATVSSGGNTVSTSGFLTIARAVVTDTIITTVPAGLNVIVDGTSYISPRTFNWSPGSSHTIAVSSPQSATTGTRYVFGAWSDGGAQSHSISVPITATTYTANFTTQYQLTTAVTPAGTGSASPISGTWYPAGTIVPVKAFANAGYSFLNWTGLVANSSSVATTVTMSGPQSITANLASSPLLSAAISGKSGTGTARIWNIKVSNSGLSTAVGARITGLTLTKTDGTATPACTPAVTSFPVALTPSDISASGSATGDVAIDFSSCALAARFTATITCSSNGGAVTGSKSYGNQFR